MNHHLPVYFGRFALAIVSPSKSVIDHLRLFFAGYECGRKATATLHILTSRDLPPPREQLLSKQWTALAVHDNGFEIGPNVIQGRILPDQCTFIITVHEDLFLPGLANVINAFFYRLYYTLCALNKTHSCIIHGCGVVRDQIGYLFIGPHHSGKTTIGLLSGAPILHDDQMILTLEGDTLTMDSPPLPARDNLRQRPEAPCVLERIFLAVKDEQFSVRQLAPEHAVACLYNDVVMPHTLLSVAANAARMRKAQLCFALQRAVPVFELHFDRQGHFWEQLSTMQWPISINEHTIDTAGDRPKRFVSRVWLEQYQQSGAGSLTILSGSMAPLINTGDQICVRKTPLDRIHIGDIITFWKGGELVTHRVIRTCIREGGVCFVERGDQHPHHSFIDAASVIGRVARINKGSHSVEMHKLHWQIFNRTVGVLFLSIFFLRLLARRIPFLPQQVKGGGNKILTVLTRIKNKALNAQFR